MQNYVYSIELPDNALFLVTEEHISIIPDDNVLGVSFDTLSELKYFVNKIYGENYGK